MATFKVGQRVRIVNGDWFTHQLGAMGSEGVIVAIPAKTSSRFYDCEVEIPALGQARSAAFWQLAPLTNDPGADAFLERIKKLKPYDEPKVEDEMERLKRAAEKFNREHAPSGEKRVHD